VSERVDVDKVVKICFEPYYGDEMRKELGIDEADSLWEAHTHGLEKFGHPNFEMICPSRFESEARGCLRKLTDDVLNQGVRYCDGQVVRVGQTLCAFMHTPCCDHDDCDCEGQMVVSGLPFGETATA